MENRLWGSLVKRFGTQKKTHWLGVNVTTTLGERQVRKEGHLLSDDFVQHSAMSLWPKSDPGPRLS